MLLGTGNAELGWSAWRQGALVEGRMGMLVGQAQRNPRDTESRRKGDGAKLVARDKRNEPRTKSRRSAFKEAWRL
jgi:hypothetical protein